MTAPTRAILRLEDFTRKFIKVGSLNMHVALEGPEDGPLVVLLHGFPEFWYSWRYQIKALAEAGYRVVAPDQRGYNLTDKTGPYDVFTLAGDIAGLVRALGREKATIVGHDWGGGVAWLVAALHPEVTERLIVCNCPHPAAIINVMRHSLTQLRKSWYIFFFQIPGLPEMGLKARNYKTLEGTMRHSASGKATDEEIGYFREAWSQPGALSAGITWYRAMFRNAGKLMRRDTIVRVPARLIWGEPDPFLDKSVAEESRKHCPGLDIQYIARGGHFVQQKRPDDVNRLMLEFLRQEKPEAQS